MAISILSTTTATLTNASFQINIPATTAGSTLIVSIVGITAASGGNSVSNIADQEGALWDSAALSDTRNDSGTRRFVQMYYRINVAAGITYVLVVPQNGNGMTMHTVVYEVTGINSLAPFEAQNTRNFTDVSSTSTSGTALVTAFTNALYIGVAIRTQSGTLTSAGGFTHSAGFSAGSTSGCHGTKIASGSNTYTVTHAVATNSYVIGIASFNPDPNAFTLDLDDSTSLSDNDANETAYDRTYPETLSLADSFAFVLGTLEYFRTLMDLLTLSESFSTVSVFFRSLSDSITLTDSVTYVHTSARTLTDNLRVQDWVELRRDADQWGN